jgi:hypothetical protein
MTDIGEQSNANVSISEEGILVKYGKYAGQKSRAFAAMILMLAPFIVLIIVLAILPFFRLLALTILAIGVIFSLAYALLGGFVKRAQLKEGTWSAGPSTFVVSPKTWKDYFFRKKGESPAPFKLRYSHDTLTWYPRLNSEAHIDIDKNDIQEIDFGWGTFQLMSPLLAEAWKISNPGVMAPHAASLSREPEEGWISVVFKDSGELNSKWVNPFDSWIDPHNASIVKGGVLVMEKGFDMSYKDLKLISESMEYHFGLPVKQYDRVKKTDVFE